MQIANIADYNSRAKLRVIYRENHLQEVFVVQLPIFIAVKLAHYIRCVCFRAILQVVRPQEL
jgi:hypothetical protein